MNNNTKFFKSLDKAKEDIDNLISKRVRTLVFDIYAGLIHYPQGEDGTPRDTARAVASWFVSENSPSDRMQPEDLEIYSLDESQSSVNSINFNPPYKTYYITNNVPYIVRLNEGHSQQAARHWVDRIFQAAVSKHERTT